MQTQSTMLPRLCLLCPKPRITRGYCEAHYRRLLRHGSPMAGRSAPCLGSLADRLWCRVDKEGARAGCWLWRGGLSNGYGSLSYEGRHELVHRIAYKLLVGPIPSGLTLDHLCRVRHCVNPAHLEPVPQRTNVLRGIGLPAQRARQTHCKRGHPFDLANTCLSSDMAWGNHRRCKTCRRQRDRARYAAWVAHRGAAGAGGPESTR